MQGRFPDFSKPCLQFLLLIAWWFAPTSLLSLLQREPTDGERLDYTVTYEWGPFYLK